MSFYIEDYEFNFQLHSQFQLPANVHPDGKQVMIRYIGESYSESEAPGFSLAQF